MTPVPYRPRLQRTAAKVGAPIVALIFAGLAVAVALGFSLLINPVTFLVALIPAVLAFVGVTACYLWLDRWEPEPPRLLLLAFFWGGGVSVVCALLAGLVFGQLGILSGPITGAAIQAPLVEELSKGAFLLLMLTGPRRKEMTTLTDCLVYAGFVGIGFAFVEDMLYASSAGGLGGGLAVLVLRLVTGAFGHALFCTMTAFGIYWSLKFPHEQRAQRYGAIALGFLGAMLLHGVWNGSAALFGFGGYVIAYLVVLVPTFVIAIVVAVKSHKREGQMFVRELPKMVAAELISHQEATWVSSLGSRKQRRAAAKAAGDATEIKRMRVFADAVTELAFLQDRVDRGHGNEWTSRTQSDLVATIRSSRR